MMSVGPSAELVLEVIGELSGLHFPRAERTVHFGLLEKVVRFHIVCTHDTLKSCCIYGTFV
jgi:hypothetical protein